MIQQTPSRPYSASDEPTPRVRTASMSEAERIRRVQQLGREIAEWSTELNRRLA